MTFLHLADLHLGRSLHERPLIEDQRHLIQTIPALLAKDDYAGLILAGDIWDRSIPSKEAVELLDELLALVRIRFPALAILIIPGNHDSAGRLAYGQGLFSRLGIHIVSKPEAAFEPVWVEHLGEKCACFLLPFLAPGSLREELPADRDTPPPLSSQRDLHVEAARRLDVARKAAIGAGADYTLLVAHLFAGGGRASESERSFLGTAELVDITLYRAFDYVALGHLHRRQKAAENAWYAGSPLAWAFDEAETVPAAADSPPSGKGMDTLKAKGGLAVRLEKAGTSISMIDIPPLHPLSRLEGRMDDFLDQNRLEAWTDHYLEILLDNDEVVENPLALLRQRFPLLLSVRQDRALGLLAEAAGQADKAGRSASEAPGKDLVRDFGCFLESLYGDGLGRGHGRHEEEALFARLLAEEEEEEAGR